MRLLMIALFSGTVFFSAQAQQKLWQLQDGEVTFLSDAPLEMISASSDELRGLIVPQDKVFAFVVNISSFKGFNSPLQQQHFNENYLESNRFPQTTFKGRIIEQFDLEKDGKYTIRAKGMLNVHGVEQERIIKSEVVVEDGKMTVHSNFTVRLDDHDITIPRIVHQKIAEVIKVEVSGVFTEKKTP